MQNGAKLDHQDDSPDLGDAPIAWNHLVSLKWAQMVTHDPILYTAILGSYMGPYRPTAGNVGHIRTLRVTTIESQDKKYISA